MHMAWLKRLLPQVLVDLVFGEFLGPIMWPLLMSGVVVAANYLSAAPIPLPYLIVSVLAAFAFTAHGIVRARELRLQSMIEGKLRFHGIVLQVSLKKNSESEIDSATIGIQLLNAANFTICYKVTSYYCQLKNTVPAKPSPINIEREVLPGSVSRFTPETIAVSADLSKERPAGELRYKVEYWRKGRRKRATLSGGSQIHIVVQADGSITPLRLDLAPE